MRVRTRPTAHAGVAAAIVLGALPAALVGLDIAWVVVASGVSALLLAPILARRQVLAFGRFEPPAQVLLHAARTTPIAVDLGLLYTARHVLIDITRSDASPLERERAPRLALAVIAGRDGGSVRIDVMTRIPARGRSSMLAATFESVFPFGLFRAVGRLVAPAEVIVLPRVLRRGDAVLEKWLDDVTSGGEAWSARPVPRSPGLPAAFRPSRIDDTARDIAWRASARRMRWISIDRTPPNQERVTISLVTAVRGAGAASAQRSGAAFEAAINTCATAIDHLTRAGHEVTLRLIDTDANAPLAEVACATSRVASKSLRTLPHLLALTDVVARPAGSVSAEPTTGKAVTRARRGQTLLVMAHARPITHISEPLPPGTTLLLVDSNGRTSMQGARSAGPAARRKLAHHRQFAQDVR